jgi:stage III sporulation protein AG
LPVGSPLDKSREELVVKRKGMVVKMNESKKGVVDLKPVKALLKNEKAVKIILLAAFALIVLFFLSDWFSGTSGKPQPAGIESESGIGVEEYEKRLEQKLEKAVSAINSVGELTIAVTLDSLSETVYSERGTAVKTVITPKVRGVAIICEGGGDIFVKQKIVELVSRLLGISTTKISVSN